MHSFNFLNDYCDHCGISRIDVEDGFITDQCKGAPLNVYNGSKVVPKQPMGELYGPGGTFQELVNAVQGEWAEYDSTTWKKMFASQVGANLLRIAHSPEDRMELDLCEPVVRYTFETS